MSSKNKLLSPLIVAADVLFIAVTVGALWIAFAPILRQHQVQQRVAERETAIAELSRDLDRRFMVRRHYNPERPEEPVWYGFTPASFPPGEVRPWASDARWNQLSYRPDEGAAYRYGLYTLGKEAWLFAYGDADRDGAYSVVYRRFAEGRLVREWRIQGDE